MSLKEVADTVERMLEQHAEATFAFKQETSYALISDLRRYLVVCTQMAFVRPRVSVQVTELPWVKLLPRSNAALAECGSGHFG